MKTSQSSQFYWSDFLLGTALLSCEEVGAYMRLLCFQWQEGSLPNDAKLLARLAQADERTISAILHKFSESSDGKLRNRKMEDVRKSLNAYKKTRSENGKRGGRPKKHVVSVCLAQKKHSESLPSPIPSPSPIPLIEVAALPFNSPEFESAWKDWKAARIESKKPLKPTTEKVKLSQLAKMGEQRAIAALIHSTGYQGIFEPTGSPQPSNCSNGTESAWSIRQRIEAAETTIARIKGINLTKNLPPDKRAEVYALRESVDQMNKQLAMMPQ